MKLKNKTLSKVMFIMNIAALSLVVTGSEHSLANILGQYLPTLLIVVSNIFVAQIVLNDESKK